jgi:hypothetical protein
VLGVEGRGGAPAGVPAAGLAPEAEEARARGVLHGMRRFLRGVN